MELLRDMKGIPNVTVYAPRDTIADVLVIGMHLVHSPIPPPPPPDTHRLAGPHQIFQLPESAKLKWQGDESVVAKVERVEIYVTQLSGDLLEEVTTVCMKGRTRGGEKERGKKSEHSSRVCQ